MLLAQRQHNAIICCRGLQLEIEGQAEALANRQAPRAIDAAAKRGVQDELHAARFIKESFGDDGLGRRHAPQDGHRLRHVRDDLLRTAPVRSCLGDEPLRDAFSVAQPVRHSLTQRGDRLRELCRARRGLAEPEGNRRRRAMRILHADLACFHAPDAPGGIAQQKDVAALALDGKILIDLADKRALRLFDDVVVGRIGDRTARRDRRQARPPTTAQHPVDLVAVHKRAGPTAAAADALRQHLHDLLELLAGEVVVGQRATNQSPQIVLPDLLARGDRDHLLRQDIERFARHHDAVQFTGASRLDRRRALDQFIAGERE